MTTEESIYNLIGDLCYRHLDEVPKISHKKHFAKMRSVSYETLFLFLNAKRLVYVICYFVRCQQRFVYRLVLTISKKKLFWNSSPRLQNTSLSSYEKMLCHISDLEMKGFKVQACKLSSMVEKIIEDNGELQFSQNVSCIGNAF